MKTETLNDKPEVDASDEIEMVKCDGCTVMMTQDEYDEAEGLCPVCTAKIMRTCKRCHGDYHVDDAHAEYPMCCESCGDDEHEEIANGLREEIEELVGSWSAEAHEIPYLRRVLAFARKLDDTPRV
jgi:PHP family Zn ribbon phosphoesterase